MVLDPIPQSLPVYFFGSRPQSPTSLRDMNRSFVSRIVGTWHDSFMCDMTHSMYMYSSYNGASRIPKQPEHTFIRVIPHSCVTWLIHNSLFICIHSTLIHSHTHTKSHIWKGNVRHVYVFICMNSTAMPLISIHSCHHAFMCDMTHYIVWHDSFITAYSYVWILRRCLSFPNHSPQTLSLVTLCKLCVTWLIHNGSWICIHHTAMPPISQKVWHYAFICDWTDLQWLIDMCSLYGNASHVLKHSENTLMCDITHSCVIWLIHNGPFICVHCTAMPPMS